MFSLFVFIGISFIAAGIGAYATQTSVKTWYPTIRKPSWNPPNWLFAPVWSTLYVMMGIAAWVVWQKSWLLGSLWPIVFYFIQLMLNALWSVLFFGCRNPRLAFIEVLLLWVMILVTLMSFWSVSWVAGTLLVPYFLWVTFASILNAEIVRLNSQ